MNNIIIRRAIKQNDLEQILHLFKVVFGDEGVDTLAEIFHKHMPGWKAENWFLAEDTNTKQIVSGFCLIPYEWNFNGITLKVAELGLVGTLPEYRGKGLMKLLNKEFNNDLMNEGYHLAAIQGIPGFYHKFGYHYSVPMEHHIVLSLSEQFKQCSEYTFNEATETDIPFLMQQEKVFSESFDLSVTRKQEQWKYLLSYSKGTEYGSEFWIIENKANGEKYYFRIALYGFGSGLIISEVSENISLQALNSILGFVNKLAVERKKPFLRFNLPYESAITKQLMLWGATKSKSYGWQIKIPDCLMLLQTLKPIFEERMANSLLKGYTGNFMLNFYTHAFDMVWQQGKLVEIINCEPTREGNTLGITPDLFVPLCLGTNTWQELQYVRPDVNPGDLHFDPTVSKINDYSIELTEILFPKIKAWINGQY